VPLEAAREVGHQAAPEVVVVVQDADASQRQLLGQVAAELGHAEIVGFDAAEDPLVVDRGDPRGRGRRSQERSPGAGARLHDGQGARRIDGAQHRHGAPAQEPVRAGGGLQRLPLIVGLDDLDEPAVRAAHLVELFRRQAHRIELAEAGGLVRAGERANDADPDGTGRGRVVGGQRGRRQQQRQRRRAEESHRDSLATTGADHDVPGVSLDDV